MKYLNKLKLVAQQQKRMQSKAEHRRGKVIEKLEEQLAMAEALNRGESYSKTRRVWKTNEAGERVQIDRAKRVRSWFWVSAAGCFLSVWYGSKVVELEPGLTAIQIGKRDDLPDAIRNVIEAVRAGELDIAIEAVAERGIPEIKLHSTSKKQRAAVPHN